MFEVGFMEIVLIVGLALLVLGPEKLPGLVGKVGRWTGRARSMARQLRMQLEHEVNMEELAKSRPMHAGSTAPGSPVDQPHSQADDITAAFNTHSSTDDAVAATDTSTAESSTESGATDSGPKVDLTKPPQ